MKFQFDDGDRTATGFKSKAGDCVTRAIAIATTLPYRTVYDALNEPALRERPSKRTRGRRSKARNGVFRITYGPYLRTLGWRLHPTMSIGSGCHVHLRAKELPARRLIVWLSKHVAAVIDGVIHEPTILRAAAPTESVAAIRSRQWYKSQQFATCTTVRTSPAAWMIHFCYSQ